MGRDEVDLYGLTQLLVDPEYLQAMYDLPVSGVSAEAWKRHMLDHYDLIIERFWPTKVRIPELKDTFNSLIPDRYKEKK